ncbi:DNA replication licensing factor mcm10 [Leucoagaricus sp. SymC.cos]|nr:DNA replication licensing factor mcm10 [Leucoagaricus sp. SymC.cos]
MESSTSRTDVAQRKQEEIRAQISALQAQLLSFPEDKSTAVKAPSSPKRKQPEPTTLAPATPSPKKKRRIEAKGNQGLKPRFAQPAFDQKQPQSADKGTVSIGSTAGQEAGPSKFLSRLAQAKSRPSQSTVPICVTRTSAFSDATRPEAPTDIPESDVTGLKRDDRLALVEELERGPYEFTPPSNDPDFMQLEPHSGIRLSSRSLSHEDLQQYMDCRYYISPSQLYSIVRLQPDKQGYDVPLFGDWVTIAVVAERGPVRLTRPPVTLDPDEQQEKKPWLKDKDKSNAEEIKKPTGKKYVNFKLIDFGARSKSSGNGGQSVIRGDAFLTLLLFEADGYDLIQTDSDRKPRKLYKGGSRGAFESMAKVKEGDVIAFLNPRILKPFQRSSDTPHPVNNILALTPESADSIAVIGRSRDLGMCTVVKRDGKPCGSWCDTRVSDVCEYHLQNAVKHRRAGRAEFTAGTSGMSNISAQKRKSRYDPARQWGLKPEEPAKESTYVISGHVVSGSDADPRNMYVGETIGREGQAKAQRKAAGDADRALKSLLERDREGMRVVMMARKATNRSSTNLGTDAPGKTTSAGVSKKTVSFDDDEEVSGSGKSAFNVQVVQQLGFDPTLKPGRQKKSDDTALLKKLQSLEDVGKARKDIRLGPRPGPKIRSGVIVPPRVQEHQLTESGLAELNEADDNMVDLDDDD